MGAFNNMRESRENSLRKMKYKEPYLEFTSEIHDLGSQSKYNEAPFIRFSICVCYLYVS